MALARRDLLVLILGGLAGCSSRPGSDSDGNPAIGSVTQMGTLALASPAFEEGEAIPQRFGKDYENVNPSLTIEGVPENTVTLALIVEDPDAPGGTFVHWLVWNISAETATIPEGWSPSEDVTEGRNDFGNLGYDGPRPPAEHRYRFKLFALGTRVSDPPETTRTELGASMDGHILGRTQLTGTYRPSE